MCLNVESGVGVRTNVRPTINTFLQLVLPIYVHTYIIDELLLSFVISFNDYDFNMTIDECPC